MLQKLINAVVTLAVVIAAGNVQAAISLSSTRLIYEGKNKGASIVVRNGAGDILVQSWIEGNNPDDTGDVPFAVTPPLASLAGNKQQMLRVLYSGDAKLPEDRESVFWLNVQEIPQAADGDNVLQLAIRQRIKIFFRPAQLSGEPSAAAGALQWDVVDGEDGSPALQVSNPSEYHVSMVDVTAAGLSQSELLTDAYMVPPGQKRQFPLKKLPLDALTEFRFNSINDYGGNDLFVGRISRDGAGARAQLAPKPLASSAAQP